MEDMSKNMANTPDNEANHYSEPIVAKKKPFYSFVKRSFDIVCSFIAILILLVPSLIIALIIVL